MGCGNSKVGGFAPPPPPPPIRRMWMRQISQGESDGSSNADTVSFKSYDAWKEAFEPTKKKADKADGADARDEPDKPEKTEEQIKREEEKAAKKRENAIAIVSRLLDKVAAKLTGKIMVLLMTFAAKLLEGVEKAASERGEQDLANLINAMAALALTFRFHHKGKHKFAFIRRKMVAPRLSECLTAIIERTEGAADEAKTKITARFEALLQGDAPIALAMAAVSKSPLLAMLRQRIEAEGPPTKDDLKPVSADDVDGAMSGALLVVSAKLQAATSGHGQLSDYASMAIAMLLAGVQQTLRGSGIMDKVRAEVNGLIEAAAVAVAFAETAKAGVETAKAHATSDSGSPQFFLSGEPGALAADAEKRYEMLTQAVRSKVDEAMALVKATLTGAEGEEDENDDE